jgi:hypothetical protein
MSTQNELVFLPKTNRRVAHTSVFVYVPPVGSAVP